MVQKDCGLLANIPFPFPSLRFSRRLVSAATKVVNAEAVRGPSATAWVSAGWPGLSPRLLRASGEEDLDEFSESPADPREVRFSESSPSEAEQDSELKLELDPSDDWSELSERFFDLRFVCLEGGESRWERAGGLDSDDEVWSLVTRSDKSSLSL